MDANMISMQVMMLLQSWSANPLLKIVFLMVVPILLMFIHAIKTYFEKIHIPFLSSSKHFGMVFESREFAHNEHMDYFCGVMSYWIQHYQERVKQGDFIIHHVFKPSVSSKSGLFSPLDDQEFEIEPPYIFGKMTKVTNQSKEHNVSTINGLTEPITIKYKFILTVFVKDKKWKQKILEMNQKFEDQIELDSLKNSEQTKIYEMKIPTMKEFDSHVPIFSQRYFETTKTLDKIWFEQKDEFVTKYQHFLHGKEKYAERGDPWKFSMILYGTPGCGKTSLIKAIANDAYDLYNPKAKANLIIIPVKSITSAQMLKNIFFSPFLCENAYVNAMPGKNSNRIYVFDDFDHDMFISRQECLEQHGNMKTTTKKINENMDLKPVSFESKKENFLFDMQKKITLEDFLNVLDGITELNGARMFWCTNVTEPEKVFDKAFLRPGRQDMIIKFGRLNHQGMQFFIQQFFNEKIAMEKLEHLKINYWTPAEFKSICISFYEKYKNENSQLQIERMLEALSLESS